MCQSWRNSRSCHALSANIPFMACLLLPSWKSLLAASKISQPSNFNLFAPSCTHSQPSSSKFFLTFISALLIHLFSEYLLSDVPDHNTLASQLIPQSNWHPTCLTAVATVPAEEIAMDTPTGTYITRTFPDLHCDGGNIMYNEGSATSNPLLNVQEHC